MECQTTGCGTKITKPYFCDRCNEIAEFEGVVCARTIPAFSRDDKAEVMVGYQEVFPIDGDGLRQPTSLGLGPHNRRNNGKGLIHSEADCLRLGCWWYKQRRPGSWDFQACLFGCDGKPMLEAGVIQ